MSLPRPWLVTLVAVGPLLAGCGNGWPWGRGPDPNAAAVVQDSAPLVAECQRQFAQSLGATKVSWNSGPSVMRDGTLTQIELTAEPQDSTVLHAPRYSCTFEDGKLDSHGPLN